MSELYSEYDGLAEKWATPLHTTSGLTERRLNGVSGVLASQRSIRSSRLFDGAKRQEQAVITAAPFVRREASERTIN